ncbi:MalY/PatB family protein [Curtobacterium herbarum]|uniref:cysteine-S-conjugate beta-lyase n=1 Tax=Curtobacterium herbarum TaxID=150122 RepID=A0ABP4K773_9MICO|nr:aminotransferase class I/II-fold pyridoxal phosphate-dependent enzyme [Curtobacterium herbarum]MBM7474162.1 cystathionine beta-lyase [Curtobacterium herbarum]MCS6545985.1 aminotransferase class I/II-fold pyridoxal phosphate-dependent enzyme [Curtobacterium herbarum]
MSVMVSLFDARRTRTSEKYTVYDADVLPMFVAEMDCALAEPVRDALLRAVTDGDTGYVGHGRALPEAFADFAADRWDWAVDPDLVRTTTDVSVAAVETLRRVIEPGDQVVVMPPVYAPFWDYVTEAGGSVTEVPLLAPAGTADPYDTTAGWRMDLDGVRQAFAEGARTVLLCNPHNPLGLVHDRESLVALARLAAEWDAVVVSDEIHAPLVHADATFTPFLDCCPEAAALGVALTSASKAWNTAGTKCALMVGASDRARAWFDGMPTEVVERTGILGYTASVAAFSEGGPWLASLLAELAANRRILAEELGAALPGAGYRQPQASYLAWLDLRALPWGDDPALRLVDEARVALSNGRDFGRQGIGHARLNFGCSEDTLREGLSRLAAAV